MNSKKIIKDIFISISIIISSLMISIFLNNFFQANSMVPLSFVIGVFAISLITNGYIYGVLSSLISVFIVNYAFTFPLYKFDFLTPQNFSSAIVLLFISIATSTLTAKVKKTEKLKKENEIEKIRANLLRAISHDLRTPLTTIYGSTSTIIDNYNSLDSDKKLKLLKEVQEDCQWLIRMVENILSITKIDKNKVKIKKTSVVIYELIDAVLVKIKKRYPNAKINVDIPEELLFANMDGLLIEQVLINLLENAIIHAVGMTKLDLIVNKKNDQIIFIVKDNGCGIAMEKLQNIINGKFELTNKPIDGKKGMGIGLAVCNTIIKSHGSNLEYTYNNGSIFKFALLIERNEQHEQ